MACIEMDLAIRFRDSSWARRRITSPDNTLSCVTNRMSSLCGLNKELRPQLRREFFKPRYCRSRLRVKRENRLSSHWMSTRGPTQQCPTSPSSRPYFRKRAQSLPEIRQALLTEHRLYW